MSFPSKALVYQISQYGSPEPKPQPKPESPSGGKGNASQGSWLCGCGARNPVGTKTCGTCGKR
ncbi:unnamed protein product [Parascedosporium putredinis]|uniref:RanBP2-type domain-containing protein n=1 Tax=Parascedosporium putredinis TaxID=1442378 RepID=A0A9P1GY39_9PEZI|nr:unnamed protein product [Parascedosporium putredinis]CAI7990383.1 unnamed protein product [Parascedosporium putredinis]